MRVVVTGGTGFLGSALVRACAAAGDEVTVLSRQAGRDTAGARVAAWDPAGDPASWASVLDAVDVVVNLAGASIASRRWSNARKVAIWDSRIVATRALAKASALVGTSPRRVVSGSAVGYYGSRGDEVLDESGAPGDDFLGRLCVAWERAAEAMRSPATSVACVRTGLVLDAESGALPRMALPFKLGAGGRVGDGSQYMSWIHRDDWVALVRWVMTQPEVTGAYNATAPEPVTNAQFTETLAGTLHRPALLPAPAAALRLVLGEMADALLLASQRAVPARATAEGFAFTYPTLYAALQDLYDAG